MVRSYEDELIRPVLIPNPFCSGKQNPPFPELHKPAVWDFPHIKGVKTQKAQPFCQFAQTCICGKADVMCAVHISYQKTMV
jgi:hypothetical protein